MIIIRKEDYGCIFTLDDETKELYYAPIYQDNSVNLSEFTLVELDEADDEYELLSIKNELMNLNQ